VVERSDTTGKVEDETTPEEVADGFATGRKARGGNCRYDSYGGRRSIAPYSGGVASRKPRL